MNQALHDFAGVGLDPFAKELGEQLFDPRDGPLGRLRRKGVVEQFSNRGMPRRIE